ncbi:MAG: hypothetical protein AB8F74_23320 [Saprospiraceae bacterium]
MRKKNLTATLKKSILVALAIFTIAGTSLFAQSIEGGAGIIHVNGDPNGIPALEDVTVNEAHIAYDTSAQVVYFFDHDGTAGTDQWIAVDINSVVSDVQGSGDISVTNVGSVYTVDFTEAITTLTWDDATNTLTYVNENGGAGVDIDLSGAVDFEDSNTINVDGDGTSGDPYSFTLDGSDTATTGQVPTSDGSGSLTWGQVVQSAAFTATGELELTLSDGVTKVLVDMENIPTVQNVGQLTAAAAAVDSDSGGVARAAATNTFGLPANSNVGVLFFISN